MVTCGDDDFGNVYADVHMQDVGAFRGFGSLNWAFEDESDSTTERQLGYFHAATEHCHNSTRARCKLGSFDWQEEANSMFIHSSGISLAQIAPKQGCLKEFVKREHCLRNAGGAKDMDTDSDDDLHIVLNPLQGVVNEGSTEDSEDAEDFVILAGHEAMNDQGWQLSCSALADKAQALFEGRDKLGTVGDEKGQNGKSPGVQPHVGYGSQVYHRHYRYVRGSDHSRVGASVSARMVYSNGKPNRFGAGRGSINCQRLSLPSRRIGAFQGLSCGLEYSIPSNKTVYDVDIDALKDKPWRLPHVDVSDYFNFGFDEIGWKKYCTELAQFCMEITTQSKIRVYEGGRSGQSMTDATQVGGGCEPWSSANIHGQPIRESDAIFLIDVKDEQLSQSFSEGQSVDSGDVNICLENGNLKGDVAMVNERDVYKISTMSFGAEPQKCGSGLNEKMQVNGSIGICRGEGWTSPTPSRPKTLSPSTPPERIPKQDKREIQRGKSQSSSLNDCPQFAHEEYESGAFDSKDTVKRRENLQVSGYVKVCGRSQVNAILKYRKDNGLSRRLAMKRENCHTISSRLSRKQRLSSHKVNHGTYHSIQVVKRLYRRQASMAVSRACKVYPKGKTTQPKKQTTINIGVEHLKKKNPVGQYVEGLIEHHVAEKAERKANSLSLRTESKEPRGQGETDSSQIKDRLQGIHCLNIGVGHVLKDKTVGQSVEGLNEHHVTEKAERKANSLSLRTENKKSKGQDKTDSSHIKDRLHDIHSVNIGVRHVLKDKAVSQYVEGLNEHHISEKAERKTIFFLSSRTQSKKSKVQGEIDSSQIKDQWQGIHCEQSKEKLAKKLKEGRKCKKRITSKGCPNIEKQIKVCGSEFPGRAADALNDNSYFVVDTRKQLPQPSIDTLNGNLCFGFPMSRLQEIHSPPEDPFGDQKIVDATVSEPSQEEVKHRGRSKFERWTSHSEQVTHDSCFSSSEKQNIGRICLSRKVPASKVGQCLKQVDESGRDYMKPGEKCASQPVAGTLEQRGKRRTLFKEEYNYSTKTDELQSCQQHLDQFAAKLEKRRERFKLSVEELESLQSPPLKNERDPLRRSVINALPYADRVVVKLDRPTRKRCWSGG